MSDTKTSVVLTTRFLCKITTFMLMVDFYTPAVHLKDLGLWVENKVNASMAHVEVRHIFFIRKLKLS